MYEFLAKQRLQLYYVTTFFLKPPNAHVIIFNTIA